jgi:cytochrome d ubiquinol oxidase subunit II
VAFEFRFKAHKSQWFWDSAFTVGSTLAALMQGMILGSFVQGYGDNLSGTAHPWITPFSVFTGGAVVTGYALLGSTWLILKTEGALQTRMYQTAKRLLTAVAGFLLIVCLWTPLLEPRIMARWLRYMPWLLPLPLATLALVTYHFYCLKHHCERAPFLLSVALFICAYIGFCISLWPYIVPHTLTFWEAAAPPSALKFSLAGVIVLVPLLAVYTAYAYRVFRGKVTQTIHY